MSPRRTPSWRQTWLLFLATVGALVLLSTWYNATGRWAAAGATGWPQPVRPLNHRCCPCRLSQNASLVAAQVREHQVIQGGPSSNGQVYSWSMDGNQRGLGREGGPAVEPGLVEGLPGPVAWVSAAGHSLAVTQSGQLFTWGRNDSHGGGGGGSRGIQDAGQLGEPRAHVPIQLPGHVDIPGVRFTRVAAGRYHSVAMDDQGLVYTFGLNDFSQLGRPGVAACVGGATCRDPHPTLVPDLPPAAAIAAGRYHSIALSRSGEVWTWGLNLCGRPELIQAAMDAGVPPSRLPLVAPQRVVGGGLEAAKLVAVDTGYVHWVGLADDGGVWTCDTGFDGYAGGLESTQDSGGWRVPNKDGELGRKLPNTTTTTAATAAGGSAARGAGVQSAAGLLPGRVPGLLATSVAAGRCFTMAVAQSGEIMQWGCSLGHGNESDHPMPLAGVGRGRRYGPVARVAAGEWSAAALSEEGRVLVWGDTGGGQHGQISAPRAMKGQPPGVPSALSSAHQHYLAIFGPGGTGRWGRRRRSPTPSQGQGGAAAKQQQQQQGQQQEEEGEEDEEQEAGQQQPRQQQPRQQQWQQGKEDVPRSSRSSGGGGGRAGRSPVPQPPLDPEVTAAIRRAAPDIFSELAPFEPKYRNPCFRNQTTGALRCLPYFSIIGVSKCGTTDLHHKLMLLPGFKESRNKVGGVGWVGGWVGWVGLACYWPQLLRGGSLPRGAPLLGRSQPLLAPYSLSCSHQAALNQLCGPTCLPWLSAPAGPPLLGRAPHLWFLPGPL